MDQNDLELLQTVPLYHLQAVAKARRVPQTSRVFSAGTASVDLSATASTPVLLEIAHYVLNTDSIGDVLQDLGALEISLLRELVSCGGRTNSRDLALYAQCAGLLEIDKKESPFPDDTITFGEPTLKYQPGMALQSPHYPVPHPHGPFEQAIRQLLLQGCVFWGKQTHFVGREYASGMHDGVLIVPQTILAVIRRKWPPEPLITPDSMSDVVEDTLDMPLQAFQRTLYLYWSFVAATRGGLALVNNGLLSRTSLRQIVEHMHVQDEVEKLRLESDYPRLLFVRLLLLQLGLFSIRQNMLCAQPAEHFFSLPLAVRARQCFQVYMDTHFWNEMVYLSEINVRPVPDPLTPAHEEVLHARRQVMERILLEAPEEWHDQLAFIARTKLYVPYLLFPRQYGPRAERYSQGSNPYGWDFRLRRGWLTHREGWHMVEGGFIRAMITGPLNWMGLLQLDQEKTSAKFQYSTVSAFITGDAPLKESADLVGRLIIQPNFEIVVLAPVVEGLLVKLDTFAERISLEHVAQYRLTKASVTQAIQRDIHVDAMLAVLERSVETDIPQNVRYSLDEWERQARRIEVWSAATILEVEDSSLLDRFLADPETQSLFRRRLTPQLVEVMPAQLPAVQQLLWQQNYLPASSVVPEHALTSTQSATAYEPQWQLHEDGLLAPFYAVLNFYLVAEALLFCVRDPATGWLRITAASLQRALDDNITLPQIIDFLQHYCVDGIPGSFLIRFKLWGGGYVRSKRIHVEHAPLLRLSADVLQDLQADKEVAALLGPEVSAEQRLVHIPAENLASILELLQQRGFLTE
jgi:hypothetical protein